MSTGAHPFLRRLARKNVLAGLMFIAIAALGLWLSRDYPLGTLRRMSTGFMPQLLCWVLMGLGALVLVQGLVERDTAPAADAPAAQGRENHGAVALVAASLVAFALSIEPLGLVAAVVLLVLIASFAYRGLKWWETLLTAVVLTALCWAVFILGLGMSVKVFPDLQGMGL